VLHGGLSYDVRLGPSLGRTDSYPGRS
jgi:hypothetical protein